MDLSTFKCPVCNSYETQDLDSLRIHGQKKHNISSKNLYIAIFTEDKQEPTCSCGCEEVPKFWTLQRGYAKFVRGHSSRINNNWGHNKDALSKSQNVRREMRKNGEITAWCKGKSKEDDLRIAEMSLKISKTILDDKEERLRRSRHMSDQWISKSIVALTGSAHSQWRGGTSALSPLCRSKIYRVWAFPKLIEAGFKCSQCSESGHLEVHHDAERFAAILQKGIESLGEPGEDWDRKECFAEWVLWYHTTNKVSGKVLCEDCHAAEHKKIPAGLNSFVL